MHELPDKLQSGPFTFREAEECGLGQYALSKLVEVGQVQKIERGVYLSSEIDFSLEVQFQFAVKRIGEPSLICFDSALAFYDLSDVIPKRVHLMVPASRRSSSKLVKLHRARSLNLKVGVVEEDGYLITSLERTVVEAFKLSSVVGLEALRRALQIGDTSLSDIMSISSDLNEKEKLLPYFESLL